MRIIWCLLKKAVDLSKTKIYELSCIEELREGWVAEETLAIAVYCSLKNSDDFAKAIVSSVNHSGDSDSTGSVTGNILEAWLGIEKVPKQFLDSLELADVIEEIAKDLFYVCQMSDYSDYKNKAWIRKYMDMTFDMVP